MSEISSENIPGQQLHSTGFPDKSGIFVWLFIITVLAIAVLDLAGWLFGITFLKSIGHDWIPMTIATSLCFILSGSAIAIIKIDFKPAFLKVLPRAFAFIIILLSLATLYVYFYQFITGRSYPVAGSSFFSYFFTPESRMAFLTSSNFLLIGCIIILLDSDKRSNAGMAHVLIIPVVIVSYFIIVSYILGVYPVAESFGKPVALNSGIAFFALSAAVLLLRTNSWLLEVFVARDTGGVFARKLLPPLLFIPLIIGWFRIKGENAGYFRSDEGVILVTILYTFCFLTLIWITTRSVNKIDRKRRISDEALKKSHDRLKILSEISSRLLVSDNPQVLVNELCVTVMNFLGCQVFFNFLLDDDSGRLHLNAYSGIPPEEALKIEWLDPGVAVCGCVARDGERIIAENIQETPDLRTELVRSFGIKAYASYPLLSPEKVIGTLSFGTTGRIAFNDEELSLIRTVADQVAIAMFRIKNEKDLRDSEDRFRTIAESLPVQISISRISDGALKFSNEMYQKTFGFSDDKMTGRRVQEIYLNPEDGQKVMNKLKKQGYLNNIELQVKKADGSPLWILNFIKTIRYGGEPSYLNAFIDISQSKKAQEELLRLNRTLNAHSKSSQAMMHSGNELEYVSEVCKIIIKDCGHAMVWIGYAENDAKQSVKPVASYGFDSGYIEHLDITWDDSARGMGPTGTAIRTGKPALCLNMQTDPAFAPWREEAIKRGYSSSLVLPLTTDGKTFGAMSIYSREADGFSENDVILLSDLANDLAHGISHLRLAESESAAVNAIRESEERFKLITTNTPDHIFVQDADLRYNFVLNPQLGLTVDGMIGKTDFDILSEEDARLLTKQKKGVLKSGKPEYIDLLPLLTVNGEYQYFEGVYVAKHNKEGQVDGIIGYFRNITERKKIEEALRESEENLWSVLNSTKESVYMFDREGRFTITNKTGLKRLNKSDEKEIVGHYFSEFVPEALAKERQAKIEKVFGNGKPLEFEDEREGMVFHHNFYPVFKDKKVAKVVTYSTDITERKKAEKELVSTKSYLESLINYANAPIIVWNPDNEIQLFNHAFERLTGYSSPEVIGKKIDLLFPADSLKESNRKIKRALTEHLKTIEIPIRGRNNEIRTVLWNSANIYDNDDKKLVSTIAQGNDITERIKVEMEVSKSKLKLDIALESGNIGIWEWDIAEDRFEWDKRMGKILGSDSGSADSTFKEFEKHIHEDDIPHFNSTIQRSLKEDIPFELIYRIRNEEGEISYISTKASVEKNDKGVPVRMTGVCFDITEMKRGTEQALFKLNEDLQRSNKELEQFAYVASHDLQEPLRMVSSFTQLLSMRYSDKLDTEAQEFINYAVDGALRMQILINDLLEYSRIGTRGKKLSSIDLNDILRQTLNNLSIRINERAALVTSDELPIVFADGGQMIQLFQNLIGNALKFCNTEPRIHISAKEAADHYLVMIKDNGIGIEPQYYERIFQIFQRLHPRDEYGGTGIGLAICRRIIERHGGKIWVESEHGEGTIFKFTLRKNKN
jgi:PAS domain S-box-containing protein